MSAFEKLFQLDLNNKTEKKKSGKITLTYLSWSYAWSEFVKVYEDATYEIIKNSNGLPYFVDGSGAMCYTKVTAGGLTHEMWLPVMNGANKAMKATPYNYSVKGLNGAPDTTKTVEALTMFDVNKTVMRCLVKNLAMFGLGLYIYAGEDLPELPPVQNINKEQVTELVKLIAAAKTTMLGMFNGLGWRISRLEDIQQTNFEYVKSLLVAKIAKNEAENAKEEEK